jgi:aldehyde oxidoreductase
MVAEGIPTKYVGRYVSDFRTCPINDLTGVGDAAPEANYMLMMVESDVDITTGKVTIASVKAIYDIGTVGNVLAVEGQAFGGIQHSIGFALAEKYSSDDKRTQTLLGAGFLKCNEIPDDLDFTSHVTPRAHGPHGSSGCSEMFQSAGHVAVLNSIYNACGVRIYELPATPDRIIAGLKANEENKSLCPEPFYLGTDFYGKLDEIKGMWEARVAADQRNGS